MPEVWENGSDKVEIGFSFVSDENVLRVFISISITFISYQSQLLATFKLKLIYILKQFNTNLLPLFSYVDRMRF